MLLGSLELALHPMVSRVRPWFLALSFAMSLLGESRAGGAVSPVLGQEAEDDGGVRRLGRVLGPGAAKLPAGQVRCCAGRGVGQQGGVQWLWQARGSWSGWQENGLGLWSHSAGCSLSPSAGVWAQLRLAEGCKSLGTRSPCSDGRRWLRLGELLSSVVPSDSRCPPPVIVLHPLLGCYKEVRGSSGGLSHSVLRLFPD